MNNSSTSKTALSPRRTESEAADSDQFRNKTFVRLRSALMEDRLSSMSLTQENTGNDPYNSGVHRALSKSHAWNKRSR